MLDASKIIDLLSLEPHPAEGGFFREIYRAQETLAAGALDARYDGARSVSTAIYYLLTPETFSAMHRLASDEAFHFYLGDPVEQLRLYPDGSGEMVVLGSDIEAGMAPLSIVERAVWQGARLQRGGKVALLGTTVAPGFDFADYEHGERAALSADYPDFAETIAALTDKSE